MTLPASTPSASPAAPSPSPSICPGYAPAGDFDPLRACVHCGLCLEECPTYRISGDENNSPRGRLLLWRAEAEGRLAPDPWTDFYTDACLGCLACTSACPANVPYARLLSQARRTRVEQGRVRVPAAVAWAARLVGRPSLLSLALAPARLGRRLGLPLHPQVFPGRPALAVSTAAYARSLLKRRRPTGPAVALLTGCLMEALYREINFATVRVLVAHNVRVFVPEGQGCCGAFPEHAGLPGVEEMAERNRRAFGVAMFDRVVSNSAGCGLALAEALSGVARVQDVLAFLGEIGPRPLPRREVGQARLYVDLPCHLVHGQRTTLPPAVLDATGYPWELAPCARDCCGSGGTYHLRQPDNARAILRAKAAFLDELPLDITPILVSSNHVCLMQWHSARSLVRRPFTVSHLIQLLDPGEG